MALQNSLPGFPLPLIDADAILKQALMTRPYPKVVERDVCRNDLLSQFQSEGAQDCPLV